MSGLYNPGNYAFTWTVTDPANKVSILSGWTIQFTTQADDWTLIGQHSFTSTLAGTKGTRSQTWTSFNVINTAPSFSPTAPGNQELFVNDTLIFPLPPYSDDSGHPFTFDYNPKMPSWISIDALNEVFTFTPTTFQDVGVWTITITLDDTNLSSDTAFTVAVINRPPIYYTTGVTYTEVTVHLNYKEDVIIPSFHDLDGSDAYAQIYEPMAVPVLWSVVSDFSKITFEPTGFNEVGVHNAYVRLFDGGGAFTDTPIQITVLNKAPIFQWTPLPVWTVPMNISTDSKWTYCIYDYERHVIDLTPWKLDQSNNLVAPPYFVSQAVPKSHTITVKALQFEDIGLHTIQLKINDGGVGFTYEELIINITNWAPYFVDNMTPLNHSLKMNNSFNYHLPKYADRENNPVYLSFQCLPSVSSWAQLIEADDSILFNPDKWAHIGHYECVLSLSDTKNATHYPFYIDVVNFSPKFTNGMKPSNIKVRLNEELEVEMPVMIDTENNPIKVIQTLPPFVKYQDGKYIVSPKNPMYHLGSFFVRGEITDTQLSTPFKFFIQVINDPPDFLDRPQNQVAYLGKKTEYKLPDIFDKEGLKYTVKAAQGNGDRLPQFIRLAKDVLKFDIPDDENLLGKEYVIQFTLDDGFSKPKIRSILVKLEIQQSMFDGNGTIAQLKVVSMTRDQLLTLRILGVKESKQLLDKIDKESLKIRVKETNEEIPYNVTVRSISASSITLRLGFKNLKLVSSSTTLDTLEIKVREEISVLQLKKLAFIYLPCCIPISVKIPPQIGQGAASATIKVKKGAMVASQVGLSVGLIINVGLSMFIQYLWGLLNDMSFLTICSMISINVPGIGKILQNALMNFIYLDILQTELWLFPLLFKSQGEDDDMDQPLNMYFDENGFQSKALIKNLGSTFVYLALQILLLALLFLIKVLGQRFDLQTYMSYSYSMSRFSKWLSRQLLWNAIFRFILQQGPPMMNAAGINALGMKFNLDVGPTFSSVITIVVAIGLPVAICIFVKILKQQRCQGGLDRAQFKERYGTLTEGLSTKTAIGTYWNVLILLRWLFTTAVLILLRDHCEVQIICLFITSILFQCLILYGKPMPSPIENWASVFNEIMVSLYLYTLMHLTDFFGDNQYREEAGYVLVAIIFVSVAVNLIKFFALIIKEIKFQIRLRRKAKIGQQEQIIENFDPNEAHTLYATRGIFAYSSDINQQQNHLQNNDVTKNDISNLTVLGPISQYRQFDVSGDQSSQTFQKIRSQNNTSNFENFRSALNEPSLTLLFQGPSLNQRIEQDKSLKDVFNDNLAKNARLGETLAQKYNQNNRLGQQPRPLQLNNHIFYPQQLNSFHQIQQQQLFEIRNKNHSQFDRNQIWY